MSRLWKVLAAIIFFLSLSYLLFALIENLAVFSRIDWGRMTVLWFVASIVLYLIVIAMGMLCWYALVRAYKKNILLEEVGAVFLLSQCAKYIPGNMAQHIGRVTLAKIIGLSPAVTITTVGMETGLLLFVGGALGCVSLFGQGVAISTMGTSSGYLWSYLVAGAGLLILLLAVWGSKNVHRLLRRIGIDTEALEDLNFRVFVPVIALYGLSFVVLGQLISVVATGVFEGPVVGLLTLTGIFAVAWVGGTVVPAAPAGLGVRDPLLVAMLGPLYGSDVAVGVALVTRGITIVGDGLTVFPALVLFRKTRLRRQLRNAG